MWGQRKKKKYKIDPSKMSFKKENFELYSLVHKECLLECYDDKKGCIKFNDVYEMIDSKLEMIDGNLKRKI